MRWLPWTRLLAIERHAQLTRFTIYLLTSTGFVVGLKLRLIGQDSWADLIDQNHLLVAVLLLCFAILSFVLYENLITVLAPHEIVAAPSYAEFIDQHRRATFDEETFKQSFEERSKNWNELNYKRPAAIRKGLLIFLLSTGLLLSVLSQIELYRSSAGVLQASYALWTGQTEQPEATPEKPDSLDMPFPRA